MPTPLNDDLNIIQNSAIEIQVDPMTQDLNIIQALDDEPNDVGGLTAAQLKAKFDQAGNIIKTFLNESLIPQVLGDGMNEQSRQQNEAQRQASETARQTAETGRASAESARQSAEASRVSTEASRVSAETARASAETARANAETVRETAETARRTAETGRASAESARQSAETGRVSAESARASAETARQSAEGQRASAESARAAAEAERQTAETARQSAEAGRETAFEAAQEARSEAFTSAQSQRSAAFAAAEAQREAEFEAGEAARNVWEDYDAAQSYVPGNKVYYGGSSYVCTAPCTGVAPTDKGYWQIVARKGADGDGAGGVSSFNGREGEVVPQEGDYTADMVGALSVEDGDGRYMGRLGGSVQSEPAPDWGSSAALALESTEEGFPLLKLSAEGAGAGASDQFSRKSVLQILEEGLGLHYEQIMAGEVYASSEIKVNDAGISFRDMGKEIMHISGEGARMKCVVPTNDKMPATKGYVDTAAAEKLDKTGGVLTGETRIGGQWNTCKLILDGSHGGMKPEGGVVDDNAYSGNGAELSVKSDKVSWSASGITEIMDKAGLFLEKLQLIAKAGIHLSGQKIEGVGDPTENHHAVNKYYVDTAAAGKLDKTGTAASATKLATARTIRTNLASASTVSFDGTANVTPGVTGTLPIANGGTGATTASAACANIGALPLTGGTLTGNLTLKGANNFGTKINLGDGDYVHISEPSDDCLEIKAKKIDFVLSDTSTSRFTINGQVPGFVPSGCIMIWSGDTSTIPTGWTRCDGTNGTPDLSHCVVRGAINTTYGLKEDGFRVNPDTPTSATKVVPATYGLYYIMKL